MTSDQKPVTVSVLTRLGLFGLVGIAVSLSGCFIDSGGCDGAAVGASWTISDGAGHAFSCADVGATDVVLTLNGADYTFPCNLGSGGTPANLLPGSYTADIRLVSGARVLDQLPSQTVTVSGCGNFDLGIADFVVVCSSDNGYTATWSIAKKATGAPLSCAQAAATTVDLFVDSLKFEFACDVGAGTTTPVAPGSHVLQFVLLDANGLTLSDTGTMNVPVCGLTDVGDVPFDVR
jgi:hypothetical protein